MPKLPALVLPGIIFFTVLFSGAAQAIIEVQSTQPAVSPDASNACAGILRLIFTAPEFQAPYVLVRVQLNDKVKLNAIGDVHPDIVNCGNFIPLAWETDAGSPYIPANTEAVKIVGIFPGTSTQAAYFDILFSENMSGRNITPSNRFRVTIGTPANTTPENPANVSYHFQADTRLWCDFSTSGDDFATGDFWQVSVIDYHSDGNCAVLSEYPAVFAPANPALAQKGDTTPPAGAPSKPVPAEFTTYFAELRFWWDIGTASDPESGIGGYRLRVGTTPGGNDVYEGPAISGAVLYDVGPGHVYYAGVAAVNGAGQAGRWSETSDGVSILPQVPASERAALIEFYQHTGGDGWRDNSGWKTRPLETDGFARRGSEASWFGVTVTDNLTSDNHVEVLDLFENRLQGNIPPDLAGLTHLQKFVFAGNRLFGSLPPGLRRLEHLKDGQSDLRGNALYTFDGTLRIFVNRRQTGGDWESSQDLATLFDVDDSGSVNRADALLLAAYLAGTESRLPVRTYTGGDLNGDGTEGVLDLIDLLLYLR